MVTEYTNSTVTLIEKGFPLYLKCTITGEPMPQVIWYRNKTPVDIHGRAKIVHRQNAPGCMYTLLIRL